MPRRQRVIERERVDPDPVRAQFQVENADEVAERRLAEAVGGHASRRIGGWAGRHVHDGTGAAPAHVRFHRLAQPYRGAQVDVHQDLEILGRRRDRLSQTERADRVHQHLRRAGVGSDPVDKALAAAGSVAAPTSRWMPSDSSCSPR
jgi:hypothetical protein